MSNSRSSTPITRSKFLTLSAAGATAVVGFPNVVRAAGKLERVGVDYAYYNDPSLILKEFGWLEQRLAPQG
ncbi:MAG: hypothetical protein JOY59_01630, partial [Candidatus Eremiobacteraeota bacterium]|nr:hypothetical protein [Candidatus Eremiobacteraeota bacterium]